VCRSGKFRDDILTFPFFLIEYDSLGGEAIETHHSRLRLNRKSLNLALEKIETQEVAGVRQVSSIKSGMSSGWLNVPFNRSMCDSLRVVSAHDVVNRTLVR